MALNLSEQGMKGLAQKCRENNESAISFLTHLSKNKSTMKKLLVQASRMKSKDCNIHLSILAAVSFAVHLDMGGRIVLCDPKKEE